MAAVKILVGTRTTNGNHRAGVALDLLGDTIMANAKPISDLNNSQWNRVERCLGRIVMSKRGKGLSDVDVAIAALDEALGKWRHTETEGEYLNPPTRGYTQELVDGVLSLVPLRRRQLETP